MPEQVARLTAALEGRYRVERQLGEGGMATVCLAEDLKHRRKVALKVLKPELAAAVGAARFLAEIETTANLQHPHILPLFDSGDADGLLFYVMPHVEGESLRQRLDRERQLPVDEAVRIATNVAEALDYAHRQGVIHRDIKPANILLLDGKPIIADFGIALAVSAGGAGRMTETGLSLGTPHYMSPEQATGDQGVGPATDIWALGCVLYEMLVGDPPYTGNTPQAVLGKIITAEPTSVGETRRSVPPNVDAAIRKALERVPADRFRSASAFAAALGDAGFSHGDAVPSETASGGGPWRTATVALGAVTVLMAAALVWTASPPEVSLAATRMALTLPVDFLRLNAHRGFAVSPSGDQVVYVDRAGHLYRHEVGELDAVEVPGTSSAWYPFFSPDGQWIAYFDQSDAMLKKVRVDGTESRVLAEVTGTLRSGAWSSDGTVVVHTSTRPGLWRVPDTGGSLEQVVTGPEVAWLDLLPGGRAVVASGMEEDLVRFVVTISLETGERQTLFPGSTPRYVAPGYLLFQRQGGLWAVRFDADGLEVLGEPRLLVDNIAVDAGNGFARYAATDGALFYEEAATLRGAVPIWVGRDGSEQLLDSALTQPFGVPSISPDGRQIAFELNPPGGNFGVWVYDLDQRTTSRLTVDQDGEFAPFWSVDGSEVGFSSHRDAPLRFYHALYSQPVDRSSEARLLSRIDGDAMLEGEWTPDGRWLVFRRGSNETTGTADIWYVAPHPDSISQPLVATAFNEWNPSVSPDGRWLAYTSDESGLAQVYVRPLPGPGGRVQVSTDGGTGPRWAHSRRELFYLAGADPAAMSMTVATVRTDGDFTVESRETLFAWRYGTVSGNVANRQWDLSSDDRRVLTLGVIGGGEQTSRYVVIQNFMTVLRQAFLD